MTCRATRRERVLVSRGVHPHYRETLRTYFSGGLELDEIPLVADGDAAGTTDLAALERMLAEADRPVAGVIAAQPDFLGLLEPMPAIGRAGPCRRRAVRRGHRAGHRWRSSRRPGAYGADIAAGEGQPLGIAPQYGGPYLGILAATDALVRQIPGRLVGMTTDLDGQRAFVMTMRAREQDIRRDKAASNICTNQALLALAAASTSPRSGRTGCATSPRWAPRGPSELEAALAAVGAPRIHPGPYLNEFAVRVPDARAVHRRLLDRGVLAGLVLADVEPDDPSLADALLVCATEVTTDAARSSGSPARSPRSSMAARRRRCEAGAGSDRSALAGRRR